MIKLERLIAEVLGAALLVGACIIGFKLWWNMHNHAEQKIGAAQCIMGTTIVKEDAVKDDSVINAAHAAQLSQVVAVYDQKLKDSAGANTLLAQRLHDYALRPSSPAHSGSAACPGAADRGLPAGKSEADGGPRPGRIEADTNAVFNACDADHAKLEIVTAAYNDWRQRMITLAKP